jgi:thioredoxin-like negative regulator of GroEL
MNLLRASAVLTLLAAAVTPATPATTPAKPAPRAARTEAHPAMAVPFINDDYAKALVQARARKLPIFIDAGAPWCHTCRSMDAFVFTDKSLTRRAGQFVWLHLDTDKKENAAIVKRLAAFGIPTYYIIDPATERIALRWVGAFTVAQLDRLLDDGLLAVGGADGRPPLEAAMVKADALYADAKYPEAAAAYRGAIALAPADWPQYPRAAEAVMNSLTESEKYDEAVAFAREAYPKVRSTPSAAVIAGLGLDDAVSLPKENPDRTLLIAQFEKAAREVVHDTQLSIAADDRSGLLISLMEARRDAGDDTGRMRAAEEWSTFLDSVAKVAPNPEARAVFDPHRLSAYIEIGHPERAIPMLEQTEREMPKDYNPPARLAIAYRAMKKWDEGLAASDRAMAMAYGPRKLGYYSTRADLYLGKADTTAAVKTLEEAIAYAGTLPQKPSLAGLQKRLETLRPSAHP